MEGYQLLLPATFVLVKVKKADKMKESFFVEQEYRLISQAAIGYAQQHKKRLKHFTMGATFLITRNFQGRLY
jgi:hypothetical protein